MPDTPANKVTNGEFETDTTGWATGGTNAIAVTTDQFKGGAKSLEITAGDDAQLASYGITLTAAEHIFSIEAYIPTAYDGTDPQLEAVGFASATGTIATNISLATRDAWQKVTITFTPDAGDLVGAFEVRENGTLATAGRIIYIDRAQAYLSTSPGGPRKAKMGVG